MNAFVMAAELGSCARAAERLNMSAQMVAKHVAALEQGLGARLLGRTSATRSGRVRRIVSGGLYEGTVAHKVQVRSCLQINESRALMSAALDGFGIVLGPQDLLRTALAKGELVRVLSVFEAPSRPSRVVPGLAGTA